MDKRPGIWVSLLVAIAFGFILNTGCKKNDPDPVINDTVDIPVNHNPTNGKTTALFDPYSKYGTLTDVDGNIYKTVVIGMQIWMAENLRTVRYRNGDSIREVTGDSAWVLTTMGAYCNYANNQIVDTIATYGRLYNWYALSDDRNLAPAGWHVATYDDWMTLHYAVGDNDGAALKEKGIKHWFSPNTGADNNFGFTALPGGMRTSDGSFSTKGTWGNWWSPKIYNSDWDLFLCFFYDNRVGGVGYAGKNYGLSVRCVKDL
jgi:uncharacterized protein (TIGR02145 family)